MTALPNPFLNPVMPTTGSAVPSDLPPVIGGTAAPFDEPTSSTGGSQEAPAGRASNTVTLAGALGTDHIHEIFAGAAKIDDNRFELDEHAFLDAIEDPDLHVGDIAWRLERRA